MVDNSATLNDPSDPGRIDDAPPEDVVRDDTSQNPKPKSHASRFIYATGARPLDGFTIKRGIGIGGFGQVYYAVSDAGKEVALKHIQRNLDIELRGVGQCLNLKHPNLLALYDIRYDEAGEGWVVMEYITGESLADVIERNPNGMPQDKIAFWLSGIAAGTACLHDHGIVHRDLKPGNVFDDAGIIKVGDYGLSKFISVNRRSAQTESVGTFHYMAPEIGKGLYGREIDVYALGVILFEMLTGDVPFDGESSQEIIMKHLTAEPKLDHIAQPYRAAIARALEKDPEKRLSSVPEMLAMLNVAPPNVGAAPIAIAPPPVADEETSEEEVVDAELNDGERPEIETLFIDDAPKQQPQLRVRPQREPEIEFGPVEHHANHTNSIVQDRQRIQQRLQSVDPRPLPKEPIAHWATMAWRGIGAWFKNPNISAALKTVVMVGVLGGGIPLLVWNPRVIYFLLAVGVVYGLYYATRAVILSVMAKKDDDGTEDEVTGRAKRWQNRVRTEISERPWQERGTELLGSLLMSGAIAAVLSVVIMVLAGASMKGSVQQWGPQLAWVALLAIGGAWAVLLLTKLWEGRSGDQVLRRIAMLSAGLLLGALAFGLDAALFVDVGFGNVRNANELWPSWHEGDQPALVAYLAYFGGLFAILRWWMQADPLRSTRLSLWAIFLSGLWGFVIPFPQPWGIMLAVAISIAVQLSAPWITTGDRNRLRQQFRAQDAQA